jgi:hypothetical protein
VQKFLTYLRVSTDKQGVFGLGMEAPREAVHRYVSGKGIIIAEYVEVETGKRSDRPQLTARLPSVAGSGPFSSSRNCTAVMSDGAKREGPGERRALRAVDG